MAELSPLRRRMTEDMTAVICLRRRNDPICTRSASSADTSAGRRTGLAWRTSAAFRFIWCRPAFRGRR